MKNLPHFTIHSPGAHPSQALADRITELLNECPTNYRMDILVHLIAWLIVDEGFEIEQVQDSIAFCESKFRESVKS